MAAQWEELSKRQQEQFGSKSAFKDAKKATRKAGGNVDLVKTIKTIHQAPAAPAASTKVTTNDSGAVQSYNTTSYGAGLLKEQIV